MTAILWIPPVTQNNSGVYLCGEDHWNFCFHFRFLAGMLGKRAHLQHLCLETTLRPQRIFSSKNFVIRSVLNGYQLYLYFMMFLDGTDALRFSSLVALPDSVLLIRSPQKLPGLHRHAYGSSCPQHTVLSATPWNTTKTLTFPTFLGCLLLHIPYFMYFWGSKAMLLSRVLLASSLGGS